MGKTEEGTEADKLAIEEHDGTDEKKYGKPRQYDPSFKGPIENRSCTDIICCILFILFIIGMIGCSIVGFVRGDPTKLIYPTDSAGNICGLGDFKDRPYLFFFDLLQCARMGPAVAIAGCPTPQVCVQSCPSSTYTIAEKLVVPGRRNESEVICQYNVDISSTNDLNGVKNLVSKELCAAYYIKSASVVGRCIPSIFKDLASLGERLVTADGNNVTDVGTGTILTGNMLANGTRYLAEFYKFKEYGELIFKDVVATWWMILIGLVIAMVISLLWIFLMRWLVAVMVWVALLGFLGLFAVSTWYSFSTYYELKNSNTTAEFGLAQAFVGNFEYYLQVKKLWLGFGCASATCLIIFGLIILVLSCRICIAIELIKEGSKAIGNMLFTLMWPLIPFILQLLVVAYWAASAMHIASMGTAEFKTVGNTTTQGDIITDVTNIIPCDPKGNGTLGSLCEFVKYGGDQYSVYMQIYMVFMLFWLMNFLVALGQMTLAGAFASYYWTFNKPQDLPSTPLASSFCRALKYHLGSLAFGSLLIAIVQLIRALLEYVDHKLKGSENQVAKFCIKCMKCCFWCLEKFLKFINKNAYIMIAIYGKNFCTSAKDAFLLLMRNIVRTVVLDKITDFILFISKLVITCIIAVAALYFFRGKVPFFQDSVPDLNFYLTPVIILVFGTYLITCCFFSVYNMAVDTLFLCFLEDLERNDGSPERPYFMSKGLKKILNKRNKTAAPADE